MTATLRELLSRWRNSGNLIRAVALGESQTVAKAKEIICNDTPKPPPPADLEKLRHMLVQAATAQNFSALTPLDWRHSPFALEGKGGLLDSTELLPRYLLALHDHLRPRLLRGLATVYIKTFDAESKVTRLLGAFAAKHLDRMGPLWTKAHTEYSLFHSNQVTERLAMLLELRDASTIQGIVEIFQAAALPPLLAHSPLALHALRLAVRGIQQSSGLGAPQARHILALTSDSQGGLAFGGGSALVEIMADALLLPFAETAPTPQVRSLVEGHLLHHLKDPRLHAARWLGVRSEAKEIILRWLTEQSLDLFLDIVDEVVNESADAKRMWHNRRRFWRSYLEKGYIDEAWVVLGNDGIQYAKKINARDGQARLSFGMLTQSTDIKKHIVLMLRIDSLIIVDWSHNGRCHIWPSVHSQAPRLYHGQYSKAQLESQAEVAITHSASGVWMDRVADIIRKKTGRYVHI